MPVERVFLGWDRPLLAAAVDFLTSLPPLRASILPGLDFSDTLILVPTSETARRLKEALAARADQAGSAACAPHIWHPGLALLPPGGDTPIATPLQARAAWMSALTSLDLSKLHALFPKEPRQQNCKWLLSMASLMHDLREILGAGGLTFADVAKMAAADKVHAGDPDRWRDLAVLETAYTSALDQRGLVCAQTARARQAHSPVLPDGVQRVVALGLPDPPPLLVHWLDQCAKTTPVTIAIHAPEHAADSFDAHGRPLPSHWAEDSGGVLPLRQEDIIMQADPAAQAAVAVDELRGALDANLPCALGVCDPEILPPLEARLEAARARAYAPDGLPACRDGLWHLLGLSGDFLATGSWSAFRGLATMDESRLALTGVLERDRLLGALDDFASNHLPGSVDDAIDILQAAPQDENAGEEARNVFLLAACQKAAAWRARSLKMPLAAQSRQWILELYGSRDFNGGSPVDALRIKVAREWLEEIETVDAARSLFDLEMDDADCRRLALDQLAARHIAPPRGEADLVLHGWLELPWEPAPALIITGFNEENVPGIVLRHPFLPDKLREQLGLPCQASRFARDSFILHTLATQRAATGRLRVLLGGLSASGEPLRPSRLLTLCPDADLPDRVRRLFPDSLPDHAGTPPPRSTTWPLRPRLIENPLETISPSRLKAYLHCPYRYYLERVLGMQPVSPPGREVDAMQFGNLVHRALQAFGQDEDARRLTDQRRIAQYLESGIRKLAAADFGRRTPPLVTLQLESAIRRLAAFANAEAKSRAEGWEILACELNLGAITEPERQLKIGSTRLNGIVDRVERNRATGKVRILDFKTSETAKDPAQAHLKSPRQIPADSEWRLGPQDAKGRATVWIDLQLPLYAAAVGRLEYGEVTSVAYGCLAAAVSVIQIMPWANFDRAVVDSALACAEKAVARITDGIFWPMGDSPLYSDNPLEEILSTSTPQPPGNPN